MNKLMNFYLELSTDAEKMALFNSGFNNEEVAQNRSRMLSDAGIEDCDYLTSLTQTQLHEEMGKQLSSQEPEWSQYNNYAGNTDNTACQFKNYAGNTDNTVSQFSKRN